MNQKNIRLLIIRIALMCLIAINVFFIFFLSAQDAEESATVSGGISGPVAEIVVKDFETKPEQEQEEVLLQIDRVIRNFAHMFEFGLLGALVLLLVLTWIPSPLLPTAIALGSVLAIAIADELSQLFSEGRTSEVKDVLIDLLGGVICCSFVLLIRMLILRRMRRLHENEVIKEHSL